jgi:hypothetical protein
MKDAIKALLMRDDVVGRLALSTALVRLYARQTCDEQDSGTTRVRNGRGFSAFHDKQGTYMAQYVLGATRQFPKGVITPDQWDAEVEKLKSNQSTPIRLLSGDKYIARARKVALFHINQLVEEAEIREALKVRVAV